MAAQIVKLEGFKELDAALKNIPKATGKNVLRRALTKAANPVRDDWQAKVPIDKGRLKRSIVVGPRLTQSQTEDRATLQSDGTFRSAAKNYVEIHVGTANPLGMWHEFGTFKDAAKPAGRPAWESNKQPALETMKKELWVEIEKAAARRARKLAKG